jgi:TRAP-type C4-dicarboxylate transport system permease small subunit
MNPIRGIAIVALVLGVLALAYGGFTYTKRTHEAHIGSLELAVKDRRTVNIPVWAGVLAVVIGAGLLAVPAKKI